MKVIVCFPKEKKIQSILKTVLLLKKVQERIRKAREIRRLQEAKTPQDFPREEKRFAEIDWKNSLEQFNQYN